ncbi:arsenate reductase [Actinocorallia herbida]|uniref:Arsenate reductase n=1 Tax=Actinocorallia herbida TaxID=58109 RepID=A0A3N1CRE3_9ACTN|nr:ArsC/Spx/MgsR family protein [Actinocorallia herbida]ROO83886.1 arsenate reductase [Actinocorallia herbida]
MEIWHNPRCSKSRAALAALSGSGAEFTERRYLEDAPTVADLEDVLTRLGMEPWEITRMGEPVAKELELKSAEHDRGRWIEVLAAHPSLIQRPIILTDDGRAFVARDEASVEAALGR